MDQQKETHETIKAIMSKEALNRSEEEEAELEKIIGKTKFFQEQREQQLQPEEFKELVQSFRFEIRKFKLKIKTLTYSIYL